MIYRVGSYVGLCKSWREMKRRVYCKDEMLKQLDVKLILQRLNFLERGMEYFHDREKISKLQFV